MSSNTMPSVSPPNLDALSSSGANFANLGGVPGANAVGAGPSRRGILWKFVLLNVAVWTAVTWAVLK